MKITQRGLILACKDVGSFLASWTFSGIKADVGQFILVLVTFILINIPSDIYLMNKWEETDKKKAEA